MNLQKSFRLTNLHTIFESHVTLWYRKKLYKSQIIVYISTVSCHNTTTRTTTKKKKKETQLATYRLHSIRTNLPQSLFVGHDTSLFFFSLSQKNWIPRNVLDNKSFHLQIDIQTEILFKINDGHWY